MATRLKFNANEFRKELMAKKLELDKEQTRRLIAYAREEIIKIGDKMMMEDTGNLLDSLCWGVWQKGRLIRSGYYRQMPEATNDSYLHAISPMPPKEAVNGRYLAQLFLSQYKPKQMRGWEVVWAATTPYYAYWEYGHYNVFLKQRVQFTAMAERYDHIKQEFKPQENKDIAFVPPHRVQFLIEVPTY